MVIKEEGEEEEKCKSVCFAIDIGCFFRQYVYNFTHSHFSSSQVQHGIEHSSQILSQRPQLCGDRRSNGNWYASVRTERSHVHVLNTKYITGFSIAKDIAESGGNVAVIDLRDSPLEDVYGLAEKFNVKVYYFQADVSNEASLTVSLMYRIQYRFSSLGSNTGNS